MFQKKTGGSGNAKLRVQTFHSLPSEMPPINGLFNLAELWRHQPANITAISYPTEDSGKPNFWNRAGTAYTDDFPANFPRTTPQAQWNPNNNKNTNQTRNKRKKAGNNDNKMFKKEKKREKKERLSNQQFQVNISVTFQSKSYSAHHQIPERKSRTQQTRHLTQSQHKFIKQQSTSQQSLWSTLIQVSNSNQERKTQRHGEKGTRNKTRKNKTKTNVKQNDWINIRKRPHQISFQEKYSAVSSTGASSRRTSAAPPQRLAVQTRYGAPSQKKKRITRRIFKLFV